MIQLRNRLDAEPSFIPNFGDPIGLLIHCHRKIEAQLSALERAAHVLKEGDDRRIDEILGAVTAARRHFDGPGTKHTQDEEESLFPRIRQYSGYTESGVLTILDDLEGQHRVADRVHGDFDDISTAFEHSGEVDIYMFDACVGDLIALYRPHMLLENEVVFPAAARILPADELLALGQEMRARRADMLGLRHIAPS